MSPKHAVETKDSTIECMRRLGKYNNIVAWNLGVKALRCAVYRLIPRFQAPRLSMPSVAESFV